MKIQDAHLCSHLICEVSEFGFEKMLPVEWKLGLLKVSNRNRTPLLREVQGLSDGTTREARPEMRGPH